MSSGAPTISVVVPCFDEEASIAPFVARLRPVLEVLDTSSEVVFVDDGSADGTAGELARAARDWGAVVIARHDENRGQQAAITTGLALARGDFLITMDADLQDPPETIVAMVEAIEGVDVVYARRSDRSTDPLPKRFFATAFYWLVARLLGAPVVPQAADFRLMSRRAADALEALPPHLRVYRVALPWLRLPSATVAYTRAPRIAGHGHYTVPRMIALAWAGIRAAVRLRTTATRPLRGAPVG